MFDDALLQTTQALFPPLGAQRSVLTGGIDEYMSLISNPVDIQFDKADPFYFMTWIKRNSSATMMIFENLEDSPILKGMQCFVNTVGDLVTFSLAADVSINDRLVWSSTVTIPHVSNFFHLYVHSDGTNSNTAAKIYIDGVDSTGAEATGNPSISGSILSTQSYNYARRRSTNNFKWKGNYCQMVIGNGNLSPAQITEAHNGASTFDYRTSTFSASMLRYWPVDENENVSSGPPGIRDFKQIQNMLTANMDGTNLSLDVP